MNNLFLILVFAFHSYAYGELSQYHYNSDLSLKENEANLGKLLKKGCQDFGLSDLTSPDRLEFNKTFKTYPEEILFKYYHENNSEICYYNFSSLTRYLFPTFKSKVSEIFIQAVDQCLKLNKDAANCQLNKEFYFVDSAQNLGHICSRDALAQMKVLSCEYKNFKEKNCKGLNYKTHQSCPEFQNHRVEIKGLGLNFSKNCNNYKWKEPKCLKSL
ncbi:MAG: hypothetical protein CME62_05450 [Halobacteriovoraceae bacterium]|nr:hypothetical protein [Halobacteriovoraceae bacterium]|tara:strand:+ start:4452 stop:5096 length:645 start_codon:yes stop_codon:yes gene_type:complete